MTPKPKYEKTNEDDDYNFWYEEFNLIAAYNGQIDLDFQNVLRCISEKKFSTEIAKELNLTPEYVELVQTMFCNINWCEYGTSPRGCWIIHNIKYEDLDAKLKEHYYNHWIKEQ